MVATSMSSLHKDLTGFIDGLSVGDVVPESGKVSSQEEVVAKWVGSFESPLVSVICHSYNHERYIENALDGFLAQKTSFPFEIIVHDDASNDRTQEIIQGYQERFPDVIKTIFQKHNQYSMGRRPLAFTLPEARGKFVALCEGDDYWLSPNKLQIQAEALSNNPEAVLCFHNALRVNERREFIRKMDPCSKMELSKEELSCAPFVPTLTRMFRNYGFPWMDLPNAPIANDICLTAFLSQFGGAVYLGDTIYSIYRHHEGGVWSKKSRYEKARMTIDSRLFIASQVDDGEVNVSEQLKISLYTVLDLIGPLQVLLATAQYFRQRIANAIKRRLS
ncbi:glycosyltransferase [Alcanivorax sp.]|uniref:glycosyltransferase n=1 Tax=Alcanivorax sp. TaxID=1872427 RepID=UPI0025C348A3|nr:glycosyltransferase [Alcanivorax sp.]